MDTQHQVKQLQQQLAAREQEVAALREIAEAAAQLQSQDVQAARVMELSKKNRSLNLALEKEKSKVAKLQQALSESASGITAATKQQGNKDGQGDDASTKELTAAKERLTQMTNKIGQFEQKVFMLETENKRLVRALVREVGDDTPLSKVLEEGTDWKGRREQIIHLKDTIRQLKESSGASTVVPSSLARHEGQHRSLIEKMNKERSAEMERMQAEVEAAKKATEQLRLQYTGASSRKKVLEEEVVSLKEKLAVVLNKTRNDDKLITALRSELSLACKGRAVGASEPGSRSTDGLTELYALRSQCKQLEEQVEQQQQVIKYLQANSDASCSEHAERVQDENTALRMQLVALQDELEQLRMQRPGTSGMCSALKQQVLTLQEENGRMRAQISDRAESAATKPQHMYLTQSQQLILQEAKAALSDAGGAELEELTECEQAQ